MSRTCKGCGTALIQRPGESNWHFGERANCNLVCVRNARLIASTQEDVQRFADAYSRHGSMHDAAKELGVADATVWRVLRRAGIARKPVGHKRDSSGPRNHKWKGDNATYSTLHQRVSRYRGTPSKCEKCGTTDPCATYDWANMTGDYHNVNDYKRLCRSCHWSNDGIVSNFYGNVNARMAHKRKLEST